MNNSDETKLRKSLHVLNAVVAKANAWGKLYRMSKDSEYSSEQILDAISVLLLHSDFIESKESKDSLRLTKELRAAKAREGKLKKQIERLEFRLESNTIQAEVEADDRG